MDSSRSPVGADAPGFAPYALSAALAVDAVAMTLTSLLARVRPLMATRRGRRDTEPTHLATIRPTGWVAVSSGRCDTDHRLLCGGDRIGQRRGSSPLPPDRHLGAARRPVGGSTEPLSAFALAVVLVVFTALFWLVELQELVLRRRHSEGRVSIRPPLVPLGE
jgi:hypothetical protein